MYFSYVCLSDRNSLAGCNSGPALNTKITLPDPCSSKLRSVQSLPRLQESMTDWSWFPLTEPYTTVEWADVADKRLHGHGWCWIYKGWEIVIILCSQWGQVCGQLRCALFIVPPDFIRSWPPIRLRWWHFEIMNPVLHATTHTHTSPQWHITQSQWVN